MMVLGIDRNQSIESIVIPPYMIRISPLWYRYKMDKGVSTGEISNPIVRRRVCFSRVLIVTPETSFSRSNLLGISNH